MTSSYNPDSLLITPGFQSDIAQPASSSFTPASGRSVRPITLKIASEVPSTEDEEGKFSFLYQGQKLDTIRVVAKIEEVTPRTNGVNFVVADTTGNINVDQFVNNENTEEKVETPFQKGQYVIITGKLKRTKDGETALSAFKIDPVEDYNIITRHILEVIQAHLYHEGQLKTSSE